MATCKVHKVPSACGYVTHLRTILRQFLRASHVHQEQLGTQAGKMENTLNMHPHTRALQGARDMHPQTAQQNTPDDSTGDIHDTTGHTWLCCRRRHCQTAASNPPTSMCVTSGAVRVRARNHTHSMSTLTICVCVCVCVVTVPMAHIDWCIERRRR